MIWTENQTLEYQLINREKKMESSFEWENRRGRRSRRREGTIAERRLAGKTRVKKERNKQKKER